MSAPGASPHAGLTGLLLIVLSLGSAPALGPDPLQDEPRPKVAEVDPGLKARRDHLAKQEEWVQFRREEVKLQLTDFVAAQRQARIEAEKVYQDAKVAHQIAQYAVKEFVQGTYLQDHATLLGRIALASHDLERARDRSRALEEKREGEARVDAVQLLVARLDLQQSEFDKEQFETELKVLTEYTKDKETKRLEAAVAAAVALEAEKKGLLEVSQAKEAKLIEQAERLKVRSPEDLVIALIDDAIRSEAKVVAVITEAQKLEEQIRQKPAEAASLAANLTTKKEEAASLMGQAKAQLLQAAMLAEQVKALRIMLRDAEATLKQERDLVDRMERAAASKP